MNISVIIPTYKPGDYIWNCLDSINVQTFPKKDYEVIIVLNGCDEPYLSDIRRYIVSHTMVNWMLIHSKEGGVSNARNKALDIAKGDYITFIDDDDFVSSTYLEELYLNASPDTISLCYPLSFDDGKDNYQPYYVTEDYFRCLEMKGDIRYLKARRFFGGPVYKLLHRDIIGDRRFDTKFKNSEDSLFMFLISDKFKYIRFTSNNAVYFRRLRSGSAISSQRSFIRILNNSLLIIWNYICIYFKNYKNYSLSFFVTRCLGQFHIIINYIRK